MNGYPRETQEAVRFDEVSVNGVPTLSYTYQLTRDGERPTGSWSTPIAVDGDLGFMLQPVTSRGTYRAWVKVSQNGQNIVIDAGEIERT